MVTFGIMIKIEFDKGDVAKIIAALTRIEAMLPKMRDEMTYKQSVDYRNMVFANIDKQTFVSSHSYAPYNERYGKWKRDTMGLGVKYWELYGDLIQNIDIVKKRGVRVKGHSVGVFTSKAVGGKSWHSTKGRRTGKKFPISIYAYFMEYGNTKTNFPARPLFGPTLEMFRKKGVAEYHGYIKSRMKSNWR